MKIEFLFEKAPLKEKWVPTYTPIKNKKKIEKFIKKFKSKEKQTYGALEKITKRKTPSKIFKCYVYSVDKKLYGGNYKPNAKTPIIIVAAETEKDFLEILLHEITHCYLEDLTSYFGKIGDKNLESIVSFICTFLLYKIYKIKHNAWCEPEWYKIRS